MPDPQLPDRKSFDPQDANPCSGCSNCCEYVSLQIDRPRSLQDYDHIFWYLLHRDIWVYIDEENDWYVQFNTPCEKLENRRCSYYERRPSICRDYEPETCVRYGEGAPEKFLFKNEDDFFRYLEKKKPAVFRRIMEKCARPAAKSSKPRLQVSSSGTPSRRALP